mgnify:CR=1 FL=1
MFNNTLNSITLYEHWDAALSLSFILKYIILWAGASISSSKQFARDVNYVSIFEQSSIILRKITKNLDFNSLIISLEFIY